MYLNSNETKTSFFIVDLLQRKTSRCTVRDTEFRASFFCHFKKFRCKSLFIVNVTFKSQILKFIFCSRQSHVNQNRHKPKIEVNNVKPILHFLTVLILTVMPEIPCFELYTTVLKNRVYSTIPDTESWPTIF
jgi:hypothetical protein